MRLNIKLYIGYVRSGLNWRRSLIGIILFAYFVIRSVYLDAVPRWDAASYWERLIQAVYATKSLTNWLDLPQVIFDNYNAFGHPSMGYYGLLVLGQLIDFPNLFILNMTNLLLAMLSIFCFYKILRWFLPEEHHLPEALIATTAYALEPLFFGSSIFLNSDFPVLVFYTIALCLYLHGRYGWSALASIFMVFSKETGLMFWITIAGAEGLYAVWTMLKARRADRAPGLAQLFLPIHKKADKPLTLRSTLFRITCLILPGVAYACFVATRGNTTWSGATPFKFQFKFDSHGWNCFGFNPHVMAYRAGEIFVLNFHWVAVFVTLTALLFVLGRAIAERNGLHIKKIPGPDQAVNRWWGMLPVAFSFLIFLVFNLTFITYVIPRYVVQGGFFLILFAVMALQMSVSSRKIRCGILSVMLMLFAVQTFRTVDPLSKLAFGRTPFGKHEILQIDSAGEAVGNGFVYNSEFTAVDKLFNLMQKAMPLKEDSVIIAWHSNDWAPWFYMPDYGGVFVDKDALKRTVDWRNAFHYNVIDINALKAEQAPVNAFYLYMPWMSHVSNEALELAKLRVLYQISGPNEVEYQGYNLRFYRLTRVQKSS